MQNNAFTEIHIFPPAYRGDILSLSDFIANLRGKGIEPHGILLSIQQYYNFNQDMIHNQRYMNVGVIGNVSLNFFMGIPIFTVSHIKGYKCNDCEEPAFRALSNFQGEITFCCQTHYESWKVLEVLKNSVVKV